VYSGKIKRVDTLAKRPVRDVPVQYFAVTLDLERTDPTWMKPGARVHAVLKLEDRSALVLPRQAVFEDRGHPIVYRWQGGAFAPAQVKLGPSSLGRVVIEEGLNDGDRIALVDPTRVADKAASKEKKQ
jgi:HlyD family secretion protein